MKQRKIFLEDPYKTELKTKIIKVDENNHKIVVPEETIIFSFSGGQENDEGFINEHKVVNSFYDEEKNIQYEIEKNQGLKKNDFVLLTINWNKRYKLMKLHSAAHIVYYIAKEILGFEELIGSNITSEKARLDFIYHNAITDKINEIEEQSNKIIKQEKEIRTFQDNHGFQHWFCNNWDMLCGGTHVKNTKEIGSIMLKRKNIGKGKERIEIKLKD